MLLSLCSLLLAPTRFLLALRALLARAGLAVAAVAAGVAYGLWGVGVLLRRGPRATFGRRDRWDGPPPPGLADGTFGDHRYLRLKDSGLRLHYVTCGPPTAPLVLLLHGFPQNWFCWRHVMRELSGTFRVVALDLRGCGASEKPPDRESYRLELLLGDVCQVIEALGTPPGRPRCVLVGHDWGGVLAWEVAATRPGLVEKLVVMDAPQRGVMAAAVAARAAAVPGGLPAGEDGPGGALDGAAARGADGAGGGGLPVRAGPARGAQPPHPLLPQPLPGHADPAGAAPAPDAAALGVPRRLPGPPRGTRHAPQAPPPGPAPPPARSQPLAARGAAPPPGPADWPVPGRGPAGHVATPHGGESTNGEGFGKGGA